jgi:hypothetical protein
MFRLGHRLAGSPPIQPGRAGLITRRGVRFAPARTPGGPSENSAARRDEQLPRKPDGRHCLIACRRPSLFCALNSRRSELSPKSPKVRCNEHTRRKYRSDIGMRIRRWLFRPKPPITQSLRRQPFEFRETIRTEFFPVDPPELYSRRPSTLRSPEAVSVSKRMAAVQIFDGSARGSGVTPVA